MTQAAATATVRDAVHTVQPAAPERLVTLDLIRGVAVLGILAVNISGFAGPMMAATSPSIIHPVSPADEAAFAFTFLFFEGKMRALFSLLFGAGIVLFWDRAEAAGRDGTILQFRRLCWLLLLGGLHYLLLWWGDILFVYAACGIVALVLRPVSNRWLLTCALALYFGWHLWGLFDIASTIAAETAQRKGLATPDQSAVVAGWIGSAWSWAAQEMRESILGYLPLLVVKLLDRPFWQVQMLSSAFGETLPLMLVGMVAYRVGLFDGHLSRRRVRSIGVASTAAGLVLTITFLAWAWPRDFPPIAMHAALVWGMAMPHLMMSCGYAALLVLTAPQIAPTRIGRRLIAAGRTAFSNYVLCSVIMTAAFYGWGLGLFGKFGPLAQWLFVFGGWALMLAWSPVWLRHFRRGPIEWLWRSLVEQRWLKNRIHS
ncbi:hypothetical protein WSK_2622 [Novosphingobium sp. Rr 2-17]|uniref:DUF418 domain-containing protein n=1 Tax=Novosphingobium sp. Rr 2-17 TaxID=555793 RepID=UPI0002698547|nr:DUF418 domain-containing protein [Novosphingobium sp. Rr 2-17]EIZ78575.1 hypothetical protein WSK_2622 [Novosphingobium sp. Rr 2-17]